MVKFHDMQDLLPRVTKSADKPTEEAKRLEAIDRIRAMDYGEVVVVVNEGRIVQINELRKSRFPL